MKTEYDIIYWNPVESGAGCGLCDRLRGLSGVSVLSAGFQLPVVMPWPISDACPFSLAAVLHLPHVRCITDNGAPLPDGARVALELDHPINAMPQDMFHHYLSRFYPPLFRDEDEFVSMCKSMLQRFEPVPAIRDRVDRFVERSFRSRMTGVHIRRTDKFRWDAGLAREHDDALVAHLVETVPVDQECGVFVASDNSASRQYICDRLQCRGVYVTSMDHDYHADRFRQTGGTELMADILLLAACERIVATVSSGVVWYAAELGNGSIDWVGPDDAFDPWFWGGADQRARMR